MPPGDMSRSNDRGAFTGLVHGGWGWNDVKHNLKGHDRVGGGGTLRTRRDMAKERRLDTDVVIIKMSSTPRLGH